MERTVSSKLVLGQLKINTQKNEVGLCLTPYIIFNSKWINNINRRAKTIKFLEKIVRIYPQDLGFADGLLAMSLKAKGTTTKNR